MNDVIAKVEHEQLMLQLRQVQVVEISGEYRHGITRGFTLDKVGKFSAQTLMQRQTNETETAVYESECKKFKVIVRREHDGYWYFENFALKVREPKPAGSGIGFTWNDLMASDSYKIALLAANYFQLDDVPTTELVLFRTYEEEFPAMDVVTRLNQYDSVVEIFEFGTEHTIQWSGYLTSDPDILDFLWKAHEEFERTRNTLWQFGQEFARKMRSRSQS